MKALCELTITDFVECGLSNKDAAAVCRAVHLAALPRGDDLTAEQTWRQITRDILQPRHPLAVHELLHRSCFLETDPAPVWFPLPTDASNIAWLMRQSGCPDYNALYHWSISERSAFWSTMIDRLGIRFQEPYRDVLPSESDPENPDWLAGARLNLVESCFLADDQAPAIVHGSETGRLQILSSGDLRALTGRVTQGLVSLGVETGDVLAMDMPMTAESVAIYLAALGLGCPLVTIADSFAPAEIAIRLQIAAPRWIFVQDVILRGGKTLPLYERVCQADAPPAVVLPAEHQVQVELRTGDRSWDDFLADETALRVVYRKPLDTTTILFSSGTTGAPKAIPWNQTTPIKAAVDAHLHQDVRPGDVVCWPTNMGWMMGPWLVFGSLMNRAAMALYEGLPTSPGFARFVEQAGVSVLGLVPSLVSAWHEHDCLVDVDWSGIRLFSSTGECSNPREMFYLMAQARYKPVIEYCGGTEIGGGYIAGSVAQPITPSTFTTPTLGTELLILDENGKPSDRGEVFLVPPTMGFSQQLLNGDHDQVYYVDTPRFHGARLRRHGDQLERLSNGSFRVHGRIDDTMNLGGIKVSSLQIEEVVSRVAGVREAAAIAVAPPQGGPHVLVIYTVPTDPKSFVAESLRAKIQQAIRTHLNPLFKVEEVVAIDQLPRTASNKVMRRLLRSDYEAEIQKREQG